MDLIGLSFSCSWNSKVKIQPEFLCVKYGGKLEF